MCDRCCDFKAVSGSPTTVIGETDARADGEASISDDLLVVATQRGDLAAFAELSRRYRDRYMRFAARMVGNYDDAEDALQSAFIRAYRAIDRCRDPSRVGAWLYQIVANECRSFAIRRSRRERRVVRDEIAVRSAAADPPADDNIMEDVEYALMQLDVDYREAFIMKHIEQLSYEEMAEITGDGISALKMRVKRACARLRELLEEVYDD